MIKASRIKFIYIIKSFRYLVISSHPLRSKRAGQCADAIDLKKLILFALLIFYPNLHLAVIVKRADIYIPGGPNELFCSKLLLKRILLPADQFAYFGKTA